MKQTIPKYKKMKFTEWMSIKPKLQEEFDETWGKKTRYDCRLKLESSDSQFFLDLPWSLVEAKYFYAFLKDYAC